MNPNNIISADLKEIYNSNIDWEYFFGKTVLIAGANGFLPAYMVESLLYVNSLIPNANITIIAIVRNREKAVKRFSDYLNNNNLKLITQDVTEKFTIQGNVDFIIHAASQASPKYYGVDPVGTLNANILGTNNLLQLAVDKQVEGFLYFSSSEVYGQLTSDKIPTREIDYGYLDPCNVRACYAESKRMGETMCISWMHQHKVPVKIVRPFHTYGPGMALDDGRVYADFIADVVYNRDIVMKSDGSAIRAFCYISDAIIGFFTIILKGNVGHAYNVGNNKCEVSILELAEQLVSLFPEKRLSVIKKVNDTNGYISSFVSRISPNIDKLAALGWSPIVNVSSGFSKTINSYYNEFN